MFITEGTPILVTIIAFTLYPYIEKKNLSAPKAFSALALFDILSHPLFLFPVLVNTLVNAKVSTDRLTAYLSTEECGENSNEDLDQFGCKKPKLEPQIKKKKKPNLNIHIPKNISSKNRDIPVSASLSSKGPLSSSFPTELFIPEEMEDDEPSADQILFHSMTTSSARAIGFDMKCSPLCLSSSSNGGLNNSNKFFQTPREKESNETIATIPEITESLIIVRNAYFKWKNDDDAPFLKNLNFEIISKSVTMIVGSVGSGKSGLISALLNELSCQSGSVTFTR